MHDCGRSTSPSAHAHLSLEQQHAILPLDRTSPEVCATHRERCVRRVDGDTLLAHALDAAAGEAERPPDRVEDDVG